MSGNTSETRCKHCQKRIAFSGNYWLQVETNGYLSGGFCLSNPNGRHEPTPPEGEAVPEQVKEFLTCPKCNHPRGFKAEFVWPNAIRCKCAECGEWSTREEWGLEPLAAPVVSTAAPEPEHGINNQTLDTRVVERLDKALHEAKVVAPESYKPAEGPDFGLDVQYVLEAVIAASEAIECTCQSKPDDAPCVSCKANHAAAIIETLRKRISAATPVTVEAPEG